METSEIMTIGHSNHDFATFSVLLRAQGIAAVADIRSAPYSRFRPEFNRETLQEALRAAGFSYFFLGAELGARSKDPACYENGRIQYQKLARTALFQEGLTSLLKRAVSERITLLCAEKEPLACHRSLLVARELERRGAVGLHVRPNGHTGSHADASVRLMAMFGLDRPDMFRTWQESLDLAYQRQEERIAYVEEDASTPENAAV